jgi:3-hydroxyacyl-[acyl-carrier-protein] dehydratase
VEALAQASGILAFKSRNRTLEDGYIYYLAGTDKTKFKRSVVPGDQMRLEVEIVNLRNHWMKASGNAYVDGNLVCSSMLTCAEQKVI